jgi:type IV pilus biogenesis protein CpaD/CtpE
MRDAMRLAATALTLGLLTFPLIACQHDDYRSHLAKDTFITRDRPTLRESEFTSDIPTAKMDSDTLRAVAETYHKFGEGPLSLSVSYDPKSRTNTASHATMEAARMAGVLRKSGVDILKTGIQPAAAKGSPSMTVIAFNAVTAQMPANCDYMGGLEGKQTDASPDYHLGCTVEMEMTRQIANPKDMRGRDGLDAGSARRQAYVVDSYQKGTPNQPMQNLQSATSP